MLTWVPLDTPRQEVLVKKSSRPSTSSRGTLTSMALDLHNTGTVCKGILLEQETWLGGKLRRLLGECVLLQATWTLCSFPQEKQVDEYNQDP